ncbi:MAG TPA: dihydrofolate reductase family protein [Mycobacteriales bacterium]|nr:dihydrofolate reductase family protein [Mycobacteriales bacterium]
MGAIKVHEFMSLDGVVENPAWTADFGFDPKMGETIGGIVGTSSDILLGRKTYEMFEPAWSVRTAEDDPGAPFFNDTPKHVVSSTLTDLTWRSSTLLGPYDPGAIRELKDAATGSIYISGSVTLVRALLADGLVDELHLFTYPVVLGGGLRLFGKDGGKLALIASDTYANGVVHLAYAPA